MKCPYCENIDIKFQFAIGEIRPIKEYEYVDAEIYCSECKKITAFYRIKDEDWIPINI